MNCHPQHGAAQVRQGKTWLCAACRQPVKVAFEKAYVGTEKMFVRVGTRWCYPVNDDTAEAVCQLNWAYTKLSEDCAVFQNGKTSHECANELVEKFEDVLLSNARVTA